MTSTWIAIEDRIIDGNVELVRVRNENGVEGIRLRPREGDLQDFDHYYADLARHPAVPILERTPGEVIFAHTDPPVEPVDARRVAIDALDAIVREPRLKTLCVDALQVGEDGRIRLLPRWQPADAVDPNIAVGRFLQRVADNSDGQLEAAIDALLDPSPEIRRTARSVLQGEAPTNRVVGSVKTTHVVRTRESRGALDKVDPRAAVVIPASDIAALDAAGRSAAAGLAGLPVQALDGLVAAGLPLVLETHMRAQPARIAAGRLEKETGLPVVPATGGSVFTLLAATALGTTGLVTLLSALSLGAVGLVTLPLIGGAISLALMGFTLWSLYAWNTDRSLLNLALESQIEAREERNRRAADPHLARAWNVLADARSALATADLPSAPASDLRGVLAASERELDRLSKRAKTVRAGLANANSADLERRLNALDLDDDATAPRALALAQTLQEVRTLEAERDVLLTHAHDLEDVLTELTSSIARWESSPEQPDSIDRVIAATQRARNRESA